MQPKFNLSSPHPHPPTKRFFLALLTCLLTYPLTLEIGLTSATAAPIFKPPTPPARGVVGNRSAAASRSNCPAVPQPLTALVPEYSSNRVWGLTGMERPTLWFYVPYGSDSIRDIAFTLQDESNPANTQIVYQNAKLAPPSQPGLMAIALPKSTAPLATNKVYHWFLTLNMDCTIGQRPMFVEGWVQRQNITRDLGDRLDRAQPREQVTLYADNGLWYDALTTLATLRANKPQDNALDRDWQNLLNSIGLKF